jgi:hypothetical protein
MCVSVSTYAGLSSPEQKEVDMLDKILSHLQQGRVIRAGQWTPPEVRTSAWQQQQ